VRVAQIMFMHTDPVRGFLNHKPKASRMSALELVKAMADLKALEDSGVVDSPRFKTLAARLWRDE